SRESVFAAAASKYSSGCARSSITPSACPSGAASALMVRPVRSPHSAAAGWETSGMLFSVTEHLAKTPRHASFYLACGPESGPLIIFIHGWPELSHSWRHQLRCFAALGFRCIAPDMRGYGRSSNYGTHAEYALEHSVHDMLDLLAHLDREHAI